MSRFGMEARLTANQYAQDCFHAGLIPEFESWKDEVCQVIPPSDFVTDCESQDWHTRFLKSVRFAGFKDPSLFPFSNVARCLEDMKFTRDIIRTVRPLAVNGVQNLVDETVQKSKRKPGATSRQPKKSKPSPILEINAVTNGCPNFEIYRQQFEAMVPETKMKLKSGRFVEDVMYEAAKNFSHEHLLHSFTFNGKDKTTATLFTLDELEELNTTNIKSKPELFADDGLFSRYYSKFDKIKTLSELRSILFGTPHSELLEVNDSEFWWCQLFHLLLIDVLLNSEKNPQCFALDLSESWVLSNAWHFLQLLFHDNKLIFVVGGEKTGIAGTERKDETRTTLTQSRRETGRKGDLYVRKYSNTTIDLGAGESGQYWEGVGGTKVLNEAGLLLPKAQRDIFNSIHARLGGSITALNKIVVPGLAIYGPKIMRLDLDWIGGGVTRVTSTDWFTLELSGAPDDNLEMFVEVFMFRLLILELEKLEGDKKLEHDDGASLGKLKALKAKIINKKGLMDAARLLDGSHPTPRK